MSEIEDNADIEFDKLSEQVDLGKLDVHNIIILSGIDEQEVSEELLGVVLAPADDTLSTLGWHS